MGIVTSMCVPKNRIREYRLDSQARILLNDLRTIKHMSMTEGGTHTIYLRENGYIITNKSKHSNKSRRVELGEGIKLTNNTGRNLSFNYNGSPINSCTITIIDQTIMKHHEITIVPHTGRILLKE